MTSGPYPPFFSHCQVDPTPPVLLSQPRDLLPPNIAVVAAIQSRDQFAVMSRLKPRRECTLLSACVFSSFPLCRHFLSAPRLPQFGSTRSQFRRPSSSNSSQASQPLASLSMLADSPLP